MASPLLSTLRTTFTRHHLLLARLGWTAVCFLVISLLVANMPHLAKDIRAEWQVGEAWPFASQFFASIFTFTGWLAFWRTLVGLVFIGTGLMLAWRKWQTAVVLLISTNLLLLGAFYLISFNIDHVRFPRLLTQLLPNLASVTTLLVVASMLSLFYLFPDGQFRPRHWRWAARLAVGNAFLWGVLFSFPAVSRWLENKWPFLLGEDDLGWVLFMGSLMLALLVGLASQIYRYRWIASAEQKQQTKWALLGLLGIVLVPFGAIFFFALFHLRQTAVHHFIILHLELLTAAWLPLAIAFSILRYRLWNVDLIINRTAVYGSLTLLVTIFYILVVGLLSNLFQSGNSLALSTLATGLIAILFNPLRQRLQTAVNRLMYGERDDPITVLTTLGKRLEETAVPAQTLPALVQTIAQTLKLPYVAIVGAGKQGDGGAGEILAAYPTHHTPHPTPHAFPLTYQSTLIGQLLVASRAPGETFDPAETRLLENVARQAGTAVYATQLTHDLQRSRQQLVTTREEERRRIRRDLHDGLGPQLATLSLKADAARNQLGQNPAATNQLLCELKGEIQNAISDIRRLVNELRPAALDQLGLVSALQEHIARQNGRLSITLIAPETLPPLPAAVEVAAYRIALEALTNTIRHAHAQSCQLHLEINSGLHLEIRDNGIGLPIDYRNGIGLSSMRERTAELGGTFQIESQPGSGTIIRVCLPF
ncbi:MAG: GAF domain-containing sensor histidine kinase [Ardenticatenaceae bacterium]|nr:GAF domain-containing sensor histidine kinase [Ardenticatenaceae bacterium]